MSDKKYDPKLTSQYYSKFGSFSTNYSVTFMLKEHLTVALRPYINDAKPTNTQDRIDRVMAALIEIALANEDIMREVEKKSQE